MQRKNITFILHKVLGGNRVKHARTVSFLLHKPSKLTVDLGGKIDRADGLGGWTLQHPLDDDPGRRVLGGITLPKLEDKLSKGFFVRNLGHVVIRFSTVQLQQLVQSGKVGQFGIVPKLALYLGR